MTEPSSSARDEGSVAAYKVPEVSGCLPDLALDAYTTALATAEAGPHMSNFDGVVDDGADEALHRGDRITHAAWNFNGLVVLRDGIYVEWVRRYGAVACRHTAASLGDLMEDVNNAHGWE